MSISYVSGQWQIQERGPEDPPPPLFSNENEARKCRKNFFGRLPPPPSSQVLDNRPHPSFLTEGLDPGAPNDGFFLL